MLAFATLLVLVGATPPAASAPHPGPSRPHAVLAATRTGGVVVTRGDSLTPAERAVARAVDQRTPEAIALLERIVNVNSGTMNFAGVRQVGDILRARLDALGFRT
ncbi:MAG: hypothetical protein HY275_15365, partial [Gemmatimonadetes bacterium]|nr:hypothetical protein [Gemmatimonadota bacterium]